MKEILINHIQQNLPDSWKEITALVLFGVAAKILTVKEGDEYLNKIGKK